MLARRQLASLLGAAAFGSLAPDASAAGLLYRALFTIARSKNKNVVRYSARCRSQALDGSAPIEAHWLMLAEDGRREELTWAERQLAYGFSASSVTSESCQLRLVAFKARPLSIARHADGFGAFVDIAGQRARLERIFVQTSEGALLPSVQHVDLFGRSLNGAALSERILAR